MTTTPQIARALGCSCSGPLLLRGDRIIGTTESQETSSSLGVPFFWLDDRLGIWQQSGSSKRRVGKAERDVITRQQVKAEDVRARYTVLDVWRLLFPHSAPAKPGLYHSPFRNDRNPSFSVYAQGHRFSDKASGESGSCLDFYMLATGKPLKDAIAELANGMESRAVIPPPQHDRELVVTETQRRYAQDAMAGFASALQEPSSQLRKLLDAKGISEATARAMHRDGSLGAIDGKPVFLYPYGIKQRHEAASSRSNRWLCGSGGEWPWRSHLIENPHVTRAVICEGETDAMRLAGLLSQGRRRLILAAPGVSWSPTDDMLHMIGAHREVLIWFDNDKAGNEAADALLADFQAVSHCNARRVMFRDGDAKDICATPVDRLREIICDFCCVG